MLKKLLIMLGVIFVLTIIIWMLYSPKKSDMREPANKPKQQKDNRTVLDSDKKKKVVKIKTDKKKFIKETKIKEIIPKDKAEMQASIDRAWGERKIYTGDELHARINPEIINESSVEEWPKDEKISANIKTCISELQKALGYVDGFLKKKDYELSFFNGSYQGANIEDPAGADMWRLILDKDFVSTIKKNIYTDESCTKYKREFWIQFYQKSFVPELMSFNDLNEQHITFFESGKIKKYSVKLPDKGRYLAYWNENGTIKSERRLGLNAGRIIPYPRKKE